MYIPYSRQDINEDDIAAVVSVLKSDFITQGPVIPQFEKSVCAYTGAAEAVAVSSGTAALHIACLALGIGKGDIVWTTPISFVASANCAVYCGADVDFVDVDPQTANIDINALVEKLAHAEENNHLPKALVIVHYSGRACDMLAISTLARKFGIKIIEDAAHALGAEYPHGGMVGNGLHSDMTMLSFHPVKSVTTGEGGVLVTNNTALAKTLRKLRSHGITRETANFIDPAQGDWYYEMQELGYHYRLTDIQAALGKSQMNRLQSFIDRRRAVAEKYETLLKDDHLLLPPPDHKSAWHLYPIQLLADAKIDRKALFDCLRTNGIGVNVHYMPIHLQPFYRQRGFKSGDYPMSELFYSRTLSIPIFPALDDEKQNYICLKIKEALG